MRIASAFDLKSRIRSVIALSRFFYYRVPVLGKYFSYLIDRSLLIIYGIDLYSYSIDIKHLSIAHPVGVILGGNGIFSPGRVAIMGGVSFVGGRPSDTEYLKKHKENRVFELGDNVVIATGCTLIGPISICDNVIIGAMSLVNKSITEPGVYVGCPVRKISSAVTEEWLEG